jgi:hypothetical protein
VKHFHGPRARSNISGSRDLLLSRTSNTGSCVRGLAFGRQRSCEHTEQYWPFPLCTLFQWRPYCLIGALIFCEKNQYNGQCVVLFFRASSKSNFWGRNKWTVQRRHFRRTV